MRSFTLILMLSSLLHCGGDDGEISSDKESIASSVARALCDREVEIDSCPVPGTVPSCKEETTNRGECEADETAEILLNMSTNGDTIVLDDAAALAELCVSALQSLTCDDYEEYSNCVEFEDSPSACRSFEDYIEPEDA